MWRLGLPHACNGIAGELTDYRIDKMIWNIDGKLVPRHGIGNPTGFCLVLWRRSMTAGLSLIPARTGAHRAPLQFRFPSCGLSRQTLTENLFYSLKNFFLY